ncbi:arylformamidase [Pontibacillus litoralis]|uniref:Kynurenine formamidase n=1 Tax=Pontibacillus litoralis JSM 072002 TaxID=1385512 RepID=A0A0A5HTS7_9BACI|nr:arylformamidase [Pontibacillus litoralis]KGX86992.1 kynurenine formamidase [Pontibacillus litoralis JSM 072002]
MDKKWIDISQPLHDSIGHWPGDTPFSYNITYSKQETGSVNIGRITTSLHTGTHIDAPFHFDNNGEKVTDLAIDVYIGLARVIDLSAFDQIDEAALRTCSLDGVTRVLIKTCVPNNPDHFPAQVPGVTADGAAYLGKKGIRLIGIDVPSVDALDSKEMEGHHTLYKEGIHILENVMLDRVPEGDYELIALPLPLKDADGSPVRAVIRPI